MPVYYYEYTCRDDSKIKLNDGSHIIFLNCCYKGNDISEELKNFFNYIKTGKATGEKNNFAHRLENEVAMNRYNEEWEVAYMTIAEFVQFEARKAKVEGQQELLKKQISEGLITIEQAVQYGYKPEDNQ